MSATNRGAIRNERDLYSTPEAAFKPLLPAIIKLGCETVWEPACGDRRLIKWMCECRILAGGEDISTGHNFLEDYTEREAIVTNPPFSLAMEFCQHAVQLSPNVFMLLRLNFLASRKRRAWFLDNEPSALFVLSDRPSFTGNGKTDATDYAWFYWGEEHAGIFHL